MHPILLEVAVTTADEARFAAEAGADRLELCSTLEVGGVTPSPGAFLAVREAVAIPVYVLVRPRPGGFVYSEDEFDTMMRDAAWFREHGADGIVAGILTSDGRVDRAQCAELAARCGKKIVFHRAFDFVQDRMASLEVLIELGFERILTSGGAATAAEGSLEIAALVRAARGRIEILPGSGIRPENVMELFRETSCTQVHASLRGSRRTASVGERVITRALAMQMGELSTTDAELVREMRVILDRVISPAPLPALR